MLTIVAGDVFPAKERQDRERRRAVKPSTATRGYGEPSSSRGDDDELGAEAQRKPISTPQSVISHESFLPTENSSPIT
jgi:hypothetical protein